MNAKKWCVVSFILLVTLISGCVKSSSVCPLDTLLLEKDLFPDKTYFEPLVSPIAEYPITSFAQGFSLELSNDIYSVDAGNYWVVYWKSYQSAQGEFDNDLKNSFITDATRGPWNTPKEISFTSSIADDYYTACGISLGYYKCRTIAVYGRYFVRLGTSISEQGITYSTYNKLLQAIDEKMFSCAE